MRFFNFLNKSQSQNQSYINAPLARTNGLTYNDCKLIFAEHGLGKRIAQSIVKFSTSSERNIIVENAPNEAVERYKEVLEEYRVREIVRRVATLARVYGLSGLFVSTFKDKDDYQNLSEEDKVNEKIAFNALDPYNLRVEVSQDPLSPLFQTPSNVYVSNQKVGNNRVFTLFNGDPLFIYFVESALTFSGRSVYANMIKFLELWDNLFDALEKIATKASSILITNENASTRASQDLDVSAYSAQLVKNMKQGGVAFLNQGQHAEFFNLNGAGEIASMISEAKEALAMALDDTPNAILLGKELSNGLSEGSEDLKAVIMAVNNFRAEYINPIYNFIDSYLFYKAWDDNFINSIKKKADYAQQYLGLSNSQIRRAWIDDFKFEWESAYPKTPDEEVKEKDGKLARIQALKELGADNETLEATIATAQIFEDTITLKIDTPLPQEREETYL